MNVKEFSRRVGVGPHTVRYYEKLGLLSDVHRLPNGHRFFSEKDVDWLAFVQRLKETGMPLAQILKYSELRAQGDATLHARKEMLEAHAEALRNELARQQQHFEKLKEKISIYEDMLEHGITA